MALWELEEFIGPQFLGFVRNIPEPEEFRGAQWLPNRNVDDIEVDWIKGAREHRVMAKVIAYDAEAPIGPKPGLGERIRLSLPPIKLKERIGEREIIRFRNPRQFGTDVDDSIAAVYDITTRLVRSVQARVEWLRMQALSEETLAYSDAGIEFETDYGIGVQWNMDTSTELTGLFWDDVANADWVADLQVLNQWELDNFGVPIAEIVVSSRTLAYMFQNEKARALLRGTGTPTPTAILSTDEFANLLRLYGLPRVSTYDVTVELEDDDGTISTVRTMDYHRLVALPAQRVGDTLFGPTAEAISELVGTTLSSVAPGIIAKTYGQPDPPSEWVKAAAVAFPSLPSAEMVQQAEVLSSGV